MRTYVCLILRKVGTLSQCNSIQLAMSRMSRSLKMHKLRGIRDVNGSIKIKVSRSTDLISSSRPATRTASSLPNMLKVLSLVAVMLIPTKIWQTLWTPRCLIRPSSIGSQAMKSILMILPRCKHLLDPANAAASNQEAFSLTKLPVLRIH